MLYSSATPPNNACRRCPPKGGAGRASSMSKTNRNRRIALEIKSRASLVSIVSLGLTNKQSHEPMRGSEIARSLRLVARRGESEAHARARVSVSLARAANLCNAHSPRLSCSLCGPPIKASLPDRTRCEAVAQYPHSPSSRPQEHVPPSYPCQVRVQAGFVQRRSARDGLGRRGPGR